MVRLGTFKTSQIYYHYYLERSMSIRFISSEENIRIYKHTRMIAPTLDQNAVKIILLKQEQKQEEEKHPIAVSVVSADTLDAAETVLRQRGLRPLVMNLADNLEPGGCVEVGACSQEECLFRRTNLFRSLESSLYPIRFNEAIYSPGISVFKRGENELYESMTPFKVDFISCPGLKNPTLVDGHLKSGDLATLLNKIRLIFQVANQRGHTIIIAGALGCGAWRNPPRDVALAFKQILGESDTVGIVTEVVFAILKPRVGGLFNPSWNNSNFDVFHSVLTT